MNHNENSLIKKYPIINKFLGVITAILVTYFVLEWNDITKSYWGFAYLIIALPGLFIPIIKLFNRKKNKKDQKSPEN